MHVLRFEFLGLAIEVRADHPEVIADLRAVLPLGWRPTRSEPAEGAVFRARRDGTVMQGDLAVHANGDRATMLLELERLVRRHVAENAREHVFVHAGVVALAGRGIVIPGRSTSGKTTLVRELVRAGATYYSDEYAPLDVGGCVHPFCAPPHVRGEPRSAICLPASTGVRPLEPSAVLITEYLEGATWQPVRLSAAEGVLAVIENTVVARTRPAQALRAVTRMVAGCMVLGGPRGEAAEVVAGLEDLLAA